MQLRRRRNGKLYMQHAPPRQVFSAQWLLRAIQQQWVVLEGSRLLFPAENERVVYRIVRDPGTYCCHCWAKWPTEADAAQHVAAQHADLPSPDSNNPGGYCVENCFTCDREA